MPRESQVVDLLPSEGELRLLLNGGGRTGCSWHDERLSPAAGKCHIESALDFRAIMIKRGLICLMGNKPSTTRQYKVAPGFFQARLQLVVDIFE
ncbi:hypothetical protein D9M71_747020 [compost metagenome]